jgi:hypothetical protein
VSELAYGSIFDNLDIKVKFDKDPTWLGIPGSQIEVQYKGNSAREVTESIASAILQEIKRFPHPTLIRRPGAVVLVIVLPPLCMFMVPLGVAMLVIAALRPTEASTYMNIGIPLLLPGGVLSLYGLFAARVPHCLLDTLQNEAAVNLTQWFWRATFVFVLFGVGGRVLLEYWLGL